jgi:hypothetical protein
LILHGGLPASKNGLVGWISGQHRTDGTRDTRVFRDQEEKHSPDLVDKYLRPASFISFRSRGRRLAKTNKDSVGAVLNDRVIS